MYELSDGSGLILTGAHTAPALLTSAIQQRTLSCAPRCPPAAGIGTLDLSVRDPPPGLPLAPAVGKYVTPTYQEIDRRGLKPDFGNMPDERGRGEALDMCRRASLVPRGDNRSPRHREAAHALWEA